MSKPKFSSAKKLPGAIEERGPSGDLLSLGGIDPGSCGALVGASSVDFLPGDEAGAALQKKINLNRNQVMSTL